MYIYEQHYTNRRRYCINTCLPTSNNIQCAVEFMEAFLNRFFTSDMLEIVTPGSLEIQEVVLCQPFSVHAFSNIQLRFSQCSMASNCAM